MMVLALLLLLGPARAEDRPEAERLFRLGLDLIAEGDTAGALAAWDGAATTEWTAAALDYNRGRVRLAQGDLGRARLALERAARLDPANDAIHDALVDVRERSGDRAPGPFERVVTGVQATMGATGIVALALALYALSIVAGVRWRRRRSGARRATVIAMGSLAALAIALAVLVLADASSGRAIALDTSPVRSAPSPTASKTERLAPGRAVRLGAVQGAWQAVSVEGTEGWVPQASVASL